MPSLFNKFQLTQLVFFLLSTNENEHHRFNYMSYDKKNNTIIFFTMVEAFI